MSCSLSQGDDPESSKNAIDGISPYQILKPLFSREVCSYRLEQYWTYELCHGRYVRQFHEESTVQKAKGQEYYLGKFDLSTLSDTESAYEASLAEYKKNGQKRPTITVEGVPLPFIEFNMTDGTVCDLKNKPRVTRVLYVCSEDSKHELHSIKEISTCMYEAIVLSPFLCVHADFRTNIAHENDITCYSVGGSTPQKPVGLAELEGIMRKDKKSESLFDGKTIIIDASEFSGKDLFGLELPLSSDDEGLEEPSATRSGKSNRETYMPEFPDKPKYDDKVLKEFLNGDLCLHGGTGWWKYEFCYGGKVVQYHEEKGARVSTITLGQWDKLEHQKWLKKNEHKRVKQGKTPRQVSHFYGKGDLCTETKRPRQVEVKLKCKYEENRTDSVAIYLLEPQTCDYVLGVSCSAYLKCIFKVLIFNMSLFRLNHR